MDSMKHIFLMGLIAFSYSHIAAMKKSNSEVYFEGFDYQASPKKMKVAAEQGQEVNYEEHRRAWVKCAKSFEVSSFTLDGYVLFLSKELMKGEQVTENLKRLHNSRDKVGSQAQKLRARLAAHYKIHLMPNNEDIVPIIEGLLQGLVDDAGLQKAISHFKIREKTDQIGGEDGLCFPIFVLYLNAGKESAQYALNAIYGLFKDMKGRDITPRYNEKITSLIYYAQGDGDYKGDVFAEHYQLDRVCYRSDFEGEYKDYKLKNPAAGQ